MKMNPADGGSNNRTGKVTWLKLLFFSLVTGGLVQIAFLQSSIIPACTPVVYVVDGSNKLQLLDLDVPLPQKSPPTKDPASEKKQQNIPLPKKSPPTKDPASEIKRMTLNPLYARMQSKIDRKSPKALCNSFGVSLLPKHERNKRRIFMGSLLADENQEVIAANAVEVYNKYHVVALVESNSTFTGKRRNMNFGPGSMGARLLQEEELFGNKTKIIFDYWLEDLPQLQNLHREAEQRNTIWKIWVDQGMTEHDIGILTDIDEIVSREFLNALQVCDFPKLRYDPSPSCQQPKMSLSGIQFESTPACIKKRQVQHPDVILGNCIDGVGNSTDRLKPVRQVEGTLGHRDVEWGRKDFNRFPKEVIESNRFPLWDGRDIRGVKGNSDPLVNFVEGHKNYKNDKVVYGTAYHLHNWFNDLETFRHKYSTYGHPDKKAKTKPLAAFEDDPNLMVRCVRRLGNKIAVDRDKLDANLTAYLKHFDPNRREYYEGKILNDDVYAGIFSIEGNKPIFFQNEEYVIQRHEKVKKMIRADEEKYGTLYPFELDPVEESEEEGEEDGEETSEKK